MKRALLAAVALIFCAALATAAQAQEKIKLRFGVIANSARSVSSLALYTAQRKGFLTKENIDLEVIGLRGVQYQIEELDKGTVDLSHTATPYLIQAAQFNVIAARRDWAEKNKDAVVRFARAFGEAYKFVRDPKNRAEAAKIIVETTGAPEDVARAMLAFYYEPDRGVMPKQAEISMPGMAKVIELLGQTAELKAPLPAADRFVD